MYLANLHEERLRAGLLQSELSRRASVGRDAISKFEGLRRQAQPATVQRLAEALGVESETLYGVQPDPAPPVFRELKEALVAAHERGGRDEEVAELERYLERHPDRLRTWLYEQVIEELGVRESLGARDYGEAARGTGRATAKALELYPLLVLSLLELLQDLLARGPGRPALAAPEKPTETSETEAVSRPRKSTESRMAAEPDEED